MSLANAHGCGVHAKADEFVGLAKAAPTPGLKKRYADLAECFRLLAQERERGWYSMRHPDGAAALIENPPHSCWPCPADFLCPEAGRKRSRGTRTSRRNQAAVPFESEESRVMRASPQQPFMRSRGSKERAFTHRLACRVRQTWLTADDEPQALLRTSRLTLEAEEQRRAMCHPAAAGGTPNPSIVPLDSSEVFPQRLWNIYTSTFPVSQLSFASASHPT